MINSLTTKYFETHLSTTIDFHPGVNVITGESDEGKSGIIRQIKWNSQNRPQGDSYRNDQLDPKKKEDKLKVVEVGINYKDSGLVIRARDGFAGGINHYTIDNEEPLRALRTDVPDEVQDITRMKDVNIQGQHPTEQYFLLADKPGQVAKEFNKVAGLTIMDKATFDINSQVRTCNTEIKIAEKEIKNLQEELDDTEWVEAAEKLAKKLSLFKEKLEKKQIEYDLLSKKIINIESIEFALTKFNGVYKALKDLSSLEKEKQEIKDKQYQIDTINNTVSAILDVDSQLDTYIDIDIALKTLRKLKIAKENISNTTKRLEKTNNLIQQIKENEKQSKIAEEELDGANVLYTKIWSEQDCPTCGRKGV